MRNPLRKEHYRMLMGGIAAGLVKGIEEAMYEVVPNYPTELGNKLSPAIPRNGKLIADIAPLAVGWGLPKVMKRGSAKMNDVKMGITFYDVPTLIHDFAVNAAWYMGTQNTYGGLGLGNNNMRRSMISPIPMRTTSGRYPMQMRQQAPMVMASTGKYRAV